MCTCTCTGARRSSSKSCRCSHHFVCFLVRAAASLLFSPLPLDYNLSHVLGAVFAGGVAALPELGEAGGRVEAEEDDEREADARDDLEALAPVEHVQVPVRVRRRPAEKRELTPHHQVDYCATMQYFYCRTLHIKFTFRYSRVEYSRGY